MEYDKKGRIVRNIQSASAYSLHSRKIKAIKSEDKLRSSVSSGFGSRTYLQKELKDIIPLKVSLLS